MAALTEFEPLRTETVDTIRARIDANVNAGLDPADLRWQDTVAGGFFFDHTQAFALELEGVYDYVSVELPASFFLPFSFGIYLDYWGELLDLPRGQPAAAHGTVTLENTTAQPVPVAAGFEVAVPSADPSVDPLTFRTDTSLTLAATGDPGAIADVAITATETGSEYNVAAHAIEQVVSPVSGVTVDNAAGTSDGADEELDEPYKARLLLEFTGARGGGTTDDYIAETLAEFSSVGHVVVQAAWSGPNTVRLIISGHSNEALSGTLVAEVQTYWDTHAPVGADVTVATVTDETIAVAAALVLLPGYTLDGTGGTVAIRAALDAAEGDYFDSLSAGGDVQHNRAIAALLGVEGVYDVTNLTLDPGTGPVAADVAIPDLSTARLAGPGAYTETTGGP
jgi:uncharacterized phage protein gp47/JayE